MPITMWHIAQPMGIIGILWTNNDQENMKEELGDLLFSIVNLSRFLNVNSTDALEKTIKKFDTRFRYVEKNCDLTTSSLDTMEKFWNEAKNKHWHMKKI